jgi:hypothetical protein
MLENFVPQADNVKKYEGLNHFTKVSPRSIQMRKFLQNTYFTFCLLLFSYLRAPINLRSVEVQS